METCRDALSSRHSNAKIFFVEIRIGSPGHLSGREVHPRPGVGEEVTGTRVVEGVYTHVCPKARGKYSSEIIYLKIFQNICLSRNYLLSIWENKLKSQPKIFSQIMPKNNGKYIFPHEIFINLFSCSKSFERKTIRKFKYCQNAFPAEEP